MAQKDQPQSAHATEPYLLVWLALRLKGLGEVATVAEIHGLSIIQTEQLLAQLVNDERCVYRAVDGVKKYILTPNGRDEGEQALAAELDETQTREVVAAAYREFRRLNPTMLQLCTDWQIVPADYQQPRDSQQLESQQASPIGRRLNDHTDPSYEAAVLKRLIALNDQLSDVLTSLSEALDRYRNYHRRFDTALKQLAAGELDYFTKPTISSYHTIWFELHEDLLATLNLNRAAEAAAVANKGA